MPRNAAPVRPSPKNEDKRDFCTDKWRKGNKMYECTRCRYTSERRSNVGRHFRRIHCELKRHKRCVCGKVFMTKGEYYEHCVKEHPLLRHSCFITMEKYKIGKPKSRSESGSKRRSNQVKVVEVRSSPRFAISVDECSKPMQLVEKNNNDEDKQLSLPPAVGETVKTVDANQTKSVEPVGKLEVEDCKKRCLPSQSVSSKKVDIIIDDKLKLLEPSADKENIQVSQLHPKKRYRSSVFLDISNNNNGCNNQFIKPSKIVSESNNNVIHQFIDQIDFDDLDAMLNLAYLKNLN